MALSLEGTVGQSWEGHKLRVVVAEHTHVLWSLFRQCIQVALQLAPLSDGFVVDAPFKLIMRKRFCVGERIHGLLCQGRAHSAPAVEVLRTPSNVFELRGVPGLLPG